MIRTLNDNGESIDVYSINGNSLRKNGFVEFFDGGHHYVGCYGNDHTECPNPKLSKEEQKYAKYRKTTKKYFAATETTNPYLNDPNNTVYYKENDLPRIVHYCTKDVLTVAQIFRRYRGEALIEESAVVIV